MPYAVSRAARAFAFVLRFGAPTLVYTGVEIKTGADRCRRRFRL